MDDIYAVMSEQVNETPLLLAVLEDMGVRRVIDEHVGAHGNWQGVSPGTLTCIWLCHILSERQHRLVTVRDWAAARQQTWEALLGVTLRDTDCTDDRLANLLSMLGDVSVEDALDEALLADWMRVYVLPTKTVRLDTTSVSVYHAEGDEESLLHPGYSKDHRPDLRQFKTMLASLDPLGLPLCALMVPGNTNDEPFYAPAYDKAVRVLGTCGVLVVGDCKMAALTTRAHIVRNGSHYLCAYRPGGNKPELPALVQQALEHADDWVHMDGPVDRKTGEVPEKAVVYEFERPQSWTDPQTGQVVAWTERVLVQRSTHQQEGMVKIRYRCRQALQDKLASLRLPPARGRRRYLQCERETLQAKVDDLIHTAGLMGLVSVTLQEEVTANGMPRLVPGELQVDEAAWAAMSERQGWQVFVTEAPAEEYSVEALVLTYNQQVVAERGFSRLKTRCLHIRPVFLRDEGRLAGLTWLLCLALRVLTLTEWRVRTALEQRREEIVGLNPACRHQTTARPTTERMLAAFQNLTLTTVQTPDATCTHVTPLNAVQLHVLALLNLQGPATDPYHRLASIPSSTNSTICLRE